VTTNLQLATKAGAGVPEIMNVSCTAVMELKLDQIEEQHLDWITLAEDFYTAVSTHWFFFFFPPPPRRGA